MKMEFIINEIVSLKTNTPLYINYSRKWTQKYTKGKIVDIVRSINLKGEIVFLIDVQVDGHKTHRFNYSDLEKCVDQECLTFFSTSVWNDF